MGTHSCHIQKHTSQIIETYLMQRRVDEAVHRCRNLRCILW